MVEVGCCFNTLTFFQPTVVMVAPRVLCQAHQSAQLTDQLYFMFTAMKPSGLVVP